MQCTSKEVNTLFFLFILTFRKSFQKQDIVYFDHAINYHYGINNTLVSSWHINFINNKPLSVKESLVWLINFNPKISPVIIM